MLSMMHKAIRWSKSNLFLEWKDYVDWWIVGSNENHINAATARFKLSELGMSSSKAPLSTPMKKMPQNADVVALKCKSSYSIPANRWPTVKKVKFDHPNADPSHAVHLSIPLGTI